MSAQREGSRDPDAPFEAGAWRSQDGMRLRGACNDRAHPQQRWNERCPDGWYDYPVRVAWREAVPVPEPSDDETTARLHRESRLVLISKLGAIATVTPLEWQPDEIEAAAEVRADD